MSNWIHRLFNPHCSHCLSERAESKVCPSCETLKAQLERVTYENQKLLDRILTPPVIKEEQPKLVEMSIPKNIPWNVRRQMLEAEDREKAKLLRNAPVPIEELEKELEIAAEKRESIG